MTDEQIDAVTDAQWGKGCQPNQYMAHRAYARAILAAVQQPAADQWRPIDSAPKDSKARLVWVPENACQFCATWSDARGDEGPEGWCIFGGGWREYLQRATLWKPMPPSPHTNAYGEIL